MKKSLILPALAVTIGGATLFTTASHVAAQSPAVSYPPIVQKIADKFNLPVNDVEAVFEEDRKAMHAEMQVKIAERLDALVAEGKITAEQKQLILQKQEELRTNHETMFEKMEDLSPEERQTEMEKHHQEIETWAREHGIDPEYLMFQVAFKAHRGGGMREDKFIMIKE